MEGGRRGERSSHHLKAPRPAPCLLFLQGENKVLPSPMGYFDTKSLSGERKKISSCPAPSPRKELPAHIFLPIAGGCLLHRAAAPHALGTHMAPQASAAWPCALTPMEAGGLGGSRGWGFSSIPAWEPVSQDAEGTPRHLPGLPGSS